MKNPSFLLASILTLAGCDELRQAVAPPPFVACTAQEEAMVERVAISQIQQADTCIIWDTSWSSSVNSCEVERATGYIHANGTVYWRDSFLTSNRYSVSLNGVLSPSGTVIRSNVVDASSDYNSACGLRALMDAMGSDNNN